MIRRQAVISLGSNLGESSTTLAEAAARISASPHIELLALSSVYTTKPAVVLDQPDFKNAVALIETPYSPEDLLSTLLSIEEEFGRVREGESYVPSGPRTLDLDIIDMEGVVMDSPLLKLPHPEALRRGFVVIPLLEICPHYVLANQKVVTKDGIECGEIITEGAEQEEPSTEELAQTEGLLSICATPIGNLGDITLRVLDALKSAAVIYCEDTRVTRKLTSFYDINAPLRRADSHTLPLLIPTIVEELEEGKRLAFVSDAGMPGISDPGGLLVAAVRQAGYTPEVLPGASALTTALATSGIKAHNHYFGGYFPRKLGAARRLLEEVRGLHDTALVFYESVYRTPKTLRLFADVFPERTVVMARELTKFHEEILTGTAQEVSEEISRRIEEGRPLKGEVVLVVAPEG